MFDPEEYPIKWTFLSGREGPANQDRLSPDESKIDRKKEKKSHKEKNNPCQPASSKRPLLDPTEFYG